MRIKQLTYVPLTESNTVTSAKPIKSQPAQRKEPLPSPSQLLSLPPSREDLKMPEYTPWSMGLQILSTAN